MHQQHQIFKDENMRAFFNGLPKVVQEAVFQSGVKINSIDELKEFANRYTAT